MNPHPFTPAQYVGAAPGAKGLGLALDVDDKRFRYQLSEKDAKHLLEDLFSLLVVGRKGTALQATEGVENNDSPGVR